MHTGGPPDTKTTHSITTSLFQLNRGLVSHFKHFGSIRLGLDIQSPSIHYQKSCAGLLTDDRKTEPIPSRSWQTHKRIEKTTPKLWDTKTLDRGASTAPTGAQSRGVLTRSSRVRASHTHVDPEEMSWSQSGLAEAREEVRWVYSQQREGHPQRCKVRGDTGLPENSKYPVLEYKHSSDV